MRNDTFQLAGSESGTVGGVNNNWDTFIGGGGTDRIYVAPKSGYSWTAIMIADNGLDSVESIVFNISGTIKPIYFAGDVDFSSVTSMTAGVKIYGRGNDNTFTGGSLGEYVEGDGGNDTLYGNGGNDTLYGDTTTDNPWAVSYTAAGNDWLYGGDGNDQVNGQGGNDQLFGDAGDDDLYGGAGTDQLRGGQGSDELYGDAGDDLLDGSDGGNVLWGGSGIDTFQFTSAGDQSTIQDFEIGTERLRFDVGLADDFSDLTIVDDINGNAHITVGDVDITLVGVASSSINSSFIDFGLYA